MQQYQVQQQQHTPFDSMQVDTSDINNEEIDDPNLKQKQKQKQKKDGESIPVGAIGSATPSWLVKCAERCEERQMDVSGIGVQAIETSMAEVRATIEVRRMIANATLTKQEGQLTDEQTAAIIAEVQSKVAEKAAAVVEYLKKDPIVAKSITKLRTTAITLEPIYEYLNSRTMLTGYRATNSITFRVDIPQAGSVVDAIVERGVTRIDGISFVATPTEMNEARHVAITSAVEDAINQAMSALSGLSTYVPQPRRTDLQIIRLDIVGVTRPEPVNLYQGGAPQMAMMARSFAKEFSTTPVEGDEKTVSATVSVKIRF